MWEERQKSNGDVTIPAPDTVDVGERAFSVGGGAEEGRGFWAVWTTDWRPLVSTFSIRLFHASLSSLNPSVGHKKGHFALLGPLAREERARCAPWRHSRF